MDLAPELGSSRPGRIAGSSGLGLPERRSAPPTRQPANPASSRPMTTHLMALPDPSRKRRILLQEVRQCLRVHPAGVDFALIQTSRRSMGSTCDVATANPYPEALGSRLKGALPNPAAGQGALANYEVRAQVNAPLNQVAQALDPTAQGASVSAWNGKARTRSGLVRPRSAHWSAPALHHTPARFHLPPPNRSHARACAHRSADRVVSSARAGPG